ncbi:MAG TPA: methyltransferase domain-containing protein [Planctomycetaceae bacterium]|jgi:SAM-dependent methyltransferase|nr:methyltransferase domain-containing protein [Planctomycetaceae bacterium]
MNDRSGVGELRTTQRHNSASQSADLAIRRLDRWWLDAFVRGPHVLELGCGDGTSTQMLDARGLAVDVVEKDADFCQNLLARLPGARLTIHECAYESFSPTRAYDDVVFARSLDQVEAPVSLLERIRGWIAPGGRLHVVVQNAESLHRRIGQALGHLPSLTHLSQKSLAAGHKRVYTKLTLLQDLEAAGYRVRECEGFLLKPFDYDSLGRLDMPLVEELFPALFAVGRDVPDELCCQLYVLASAKES